MKRSHVSFALVTVAAALGFAGIASAQGITSDYRKVEVSYSDLDLSHVSDAQKLYRRISNAAHDACKQNGVLFRASLYRDCVGKAVGDAVHSVSNENLTAVHLREAGSRAVAAAGR